MSEIPIRWARKKDQEEIWVVLQEGGATNELYMHAYDTELQAQRGAALMEANTYSVLLIESLQKEGPERVAYGLEALAQEVLDYLDGAPENLALPRVRNRLRRRIRTLLTKAQANG